MRNFEDRHRVSLKSLFSLARGPGCQTINVKPIISVSPERKILPNPSECCAHAVLEALPNRLDVKTLCELHGGHKTQRLKGYTSHPVDSIIKLTLLLSRTLVARTLPRPSLSLSHLRAPSVASESLSATTSLATTTALPLDLLPKISTHPALAGIQVRNGPRNTYDPSHRVRKRRHGFLARKKSRTGRAILVRRRVKKRSTLSH